MSFKFDVRHSETGLLGETRIYAEFRHNDFRTFTAQGVAEVVTTPAFVKTIQHWATVSIFTYSFNECPIPLSRGEIHNRVLGVRIQNHKDLSVRTFCAEAGAPLTVVLDGDQVIITAGSGSSSRELLRDQRLQVAVLHVECPRPLTEEHTACNSVAPAQTGTEPIRLVSA
jgi:hypothetical protein